MSFEENIESFRKTCKEFVAKKAIEELLEMYYNNKEYAVLPTNIQNALIEEGLLNSEDFIDVLDEEDSKLEEDENDEVRVYTKILEFDDNKVQNMKRALEYLRL